MSIANCRFLLLTCAVLLVSGCAKSIGDACSTNTDCSPIGDLICDTAQPDGYCTVVGCGATTCIDEAACISFFPPDDLLAVPCDHESEDTVDPDVTPTNDCTPDEICLSSDRCALRSLERRFCMKPCTESSDCRDGYECVAPGSPGSGSEVVVNYNDRDAEPRSFCAPQG